MSGMPCNHAQEHLLDSARHQQPSPGFGDLVAHTADAPLACLVGSTRISQRFTHQRPKIWGMLMHDHATSSQTVEADPRDLLQDSILQWVLRLEHLSQFEWPLPSEVGAAACTAIECSAKGILLGCSNGIVLDLPVGIM